jgi:hypothetical protein
MIIPARFQTIPALLDHLETLIPQRHPAKNYAFRNVYFFLDYPVANKTVKNAATLSYVHHADVSPVGYSTKSITDPLSCVIRHNHYCWQYTKLYQGNQVLFEVNPEFAINRHYKKCRFGDECNKY